MFLTDLKATELKKFVLCPSEDDAINAGEAVVFGGVGIYMLFAKDGLLLYVGRSIDLSERIYQHWLGMRYRNSGKFFSYFVTMNTPLEVMSAVELAHIYALKPPLNVKYEPPSWKHHKALVKLIFNAWN